MTCEFVGGSCCDAERCCIASVGRERSRSKRWQGLWLSRLGAGEGVRLINSAVYVLTIGEHGEDSECSSMAPTATHEAHSHRLIIISKVSHRFN